jgi:hypothetical protein
MSLKKLLGEMEFIGSLSMSGSEQPTARPFFDRIVLNARPVLGTTLDRH